MSDKERRAMPKWLPMFLALAVVLAVLATLATGLLFIGVVSARPPVAVPAPGTPTCGGPSGTPGPWVIVSPVVTDAYGMSMDSDGAFAYEAGGYSIPAATMITQFSRYNPGTNLWTTLTPVPDLSNVVAAAVYAPTNNKLYVMGGEDSVALVVTSTTRIYDIATNTWSTGVPMPDVRAFAASGYFNGKIYVVGGYSTGTVNPAFLQTWEYTIATSTWLTKTAIPATNGFGGAGFGVVNGHLLIAGGRESTNTVINTVWDYNIAADSWTALTPLPAAVNVPGHAVINGKLWIFGGGNPFMGGVGASLRAFDAPATTNLTYIFDPVANIWSNGPPMNVSRSFPGSTNIGNIAIAVGGYDGTTTVNSVETSTNISVPCASSTPTNTNTLTATSTNTPTRTPSPSPTCTPLPNSFCPGTTRVDGTGCDDCVTDIPLPFGVSFCGLSQSMAHIDSNGVIGFVAASSDPSNTCTASTSHNTAILAHWDDLRTDCVNCGIFTSLSGIVPNRSFCIEWRAVYANNTNERVNFEVTLHEGQDRFEINFAQVDQGGSGATVGLQQGTGSPTIYSCNAPNSLVPGLQVPFVNCLPQPVQQPCSEPPTSTPTPTPFTPPTNTPFTPPSNTPFTPPTNTPFTPPTNTPFTPPSNTPFTPPTNTPFTPPTNTPFTPPTNTPFTPPTNTPVTPPTNTPFTPPTNTL